MHKRNSEKWQSKLSRMLNSAVAFSIAYLIMMTGFHLTMAVMGKVFGFYSSTYYYGAKFIINHNYWTKLSVFFVYTSGTLFVTIFGIICGVLFFKLKERHYVFNMIFLWGMVIASSVVAAQGLIINLGAEQYISPFYQNLTVVLAWLHIPIFFYYVLAVILFAFGAFCAVYVCKPFLTLSYSYSKVNKLQRKQKYFFETAIIPFVVASMGLLAFTFPLNMWINIVYVFFIGISLLLGFFALPFFEVKTDEILRYKTLQEASIGIFIVLLVLLGLLTLTWRGIYLGG